MKELDFLRRMWLDLPQFKKDGTRKEKVFLRRTEQLIVPRVTYQDNQGDLHNAHWAYCVPYAFRDALDIVYQKRTKDKKSCLVWTQGCELKFAAGDMFQSSHGQPQLQIQQAEPMKWDAVNAIMNEGSVTYELFFEKGVIAPRTITQMEFLGILIDGNASEF